MMSLVKIRMLWFLQKVPPNLTINDIKNYPFIMPLSGCKEVLEPYLMKNEITVNKSDGVRIN